MAIDSYFNRDREDDDDNYYEITDREKRILNSPPPRFYDPRIEGFPDWNARQQEYSEVLMKEKENQRQREIKMRNGLNKRKNGYLDPIKIDKKESSSDRMQKIKDLLDNY